MIRKLFYDNVYLKEFMATVLEVKSDGGNFHVVLDQTAFYPEGGGQPHDLGSIGDHAVSYVYLEDNKIYHVVDTELKLHESLKCSIDWDRRFDHMQQHLGQHILSACFEKLFSAQTVGFHMGEEFVTIDVTMENITDQEAHKVEYFANQIIFNNLHVKQLYPSPSQLEKLPLRKLPQVSENIRIIEVDQFDFSPCGGTHPTSTGEVGLIKIRKWEKIRGTTRIEFICGNRALKDFSWKNHTINRISSLFSVKDRDSLQAAEKMLSDYTILKKEIKGLREDLLSYEASALYQQSQSLGETKIILKIYEGRSFDELRILAGKIVSSPNAIVLLGTKNEKAQIILSRSKEINIPMNELFKEISSLIDGKGGGNSQTAQGGGDGVSSLGDALDAAYTIIVNRYLK